MLARAFRGQADGFYIDVGAMDPVADSVTCHFYALGWHGINVEPVPRHMARLRALRPRDLNLELALGEREETRTLYDVPGTGLASLAPEGASAAGAAALHAVEVTTLARLCAEHAAARTIDFLKIDVEGWERAVIAGGDWQRFRPRILVVEATRPNSPAPAWAEWEPMLLANAYRMVWFDGLNRFYLRQEDAALAVHFATPPNVFDAFVPWRIEALERDCRALSAEHARLAESHLGLIESQRRLNEAHAVALAGLEGQLAAVHASHSWRLTAPLRWLARRLRHEREG